MNIKDIVGEKIAVHCNSRTNAQNFLKACYNTGIKWRDGSEILYEGRDYWYTFESSTCYEISVNGVSFSDVGDIVKENYQIIEFEELDWEESIMGYKERREYRGYIMEKGRPAFNAMVCWIGEYIYPDKKPTLYAKTVTELKEKINQQYEEDNA